MTEGGNEDLASKHGEQKALGSYGPAVALATLIVTMSGALFQYQSARFETFDSQYADTGKRLTDMDAKLDRRADGVLQSIRDATGRTDAVLQQQATLAAQIGRVEAEMGYVRGRLDKIAEKLQVADAGLLQLRDLDSQSIASFDGLLTKEQFEKLSAAIARQPGAAYTAFALKVGEKLPQATPVNALPPLINDIRPAWKNLSYTVGQSGIAIIDPNTLTVKSLISTPKF